VLRCVARSTQLDRDFGMYRWRARRKFDLLLEL
jgi:hypothetical protein